MESELGKIEMVDGVFYANAKCLANFLDLTKARISQLTAEGIFQKEKIETHGFMYDIAISLQAYLAMKQSEDTVEDKSIRRERMKAEAKIKAAKAELAQLEVAELKGKSFRTEDIRAITEAHFYEIRNIFNSLPSLLAEDVAGSDNPAECAEIIRKHVNTLLTQIQKYRFDPAKYQERVQQRMNWESRGVELDEDEDKD